MRNGGGSDGKSVSRERTSEKARTVYEVSNTVMWAPDNARRAVEVLHVITERNRMEQELRKSEERYRVLVEAMTDGLAVSDQNQVFTYVNDRLCEMLGYSREELLGQPASRFVDPSDRELLAEQLAMRRKGEYRPYESTWVTKEGKSLTVIVSPKPIMGPDGEFLGSFAVATDITARRHSEEALLHSERQLRFVSAQLLRTQEDERERVSRELHDELGQALSVMKLRLALIRRSVQEDRAEAIEECDGVLRYIDQVLDNVRRLARDLSPGVLEDLGIVAALRHLAGRYTLPCRAEVTLHIDDIGGLLTKDAEKILYRVFQEGFANIRKHAEARHVTMRVEKRNRSIRCRLEDDGRGFETGMSAADFLHTGMGLAIMSERVRVLGGSLKLQSHKGRGTQISFEIPLTHDGQNKNERPIPCRTGG